MCISLITMCYKLSRSLIPDNSEPIKLIMKKRTLHLSRIPLKELLVWCNKKIVLHMGLVFLTFSIVQLNAQTNGPLKIHPNNASCFADASGKAVIVGGTHTWNSLQDNGTWGNPIFNFDKYLTMLTSSNTNFIRMWSFQENGPGDSDWYPTWYLKSGNKYDLTKFNPEFFIRLRNRCIAARDKGIYVSLCLFWGYPTYALDGYTYSYYNINNNINGVDGHSPLGSQSLDYPACVTAEENYIKRVIDEINDLDNVMFEIANEAGDTKAWQYHMVNVIHDYEKTKAKQHLVFISAFQNSNQDVDFYQGPNDAAIPWDGTPDNPRINPFTRPTILDSDHTTAGNCTPLQAWKAFLRGMFPIQMDVPGAALFEVGTYAPKATDYAMGDIIRVGTKIDRSKMYPRNGSSNTSYCLKAEDGLSFVVLKPGGGSFTVDMNQSSGKVFKTEWYSLNSRTFTAGSDVTGGSSSQSFAPPFSGDAVLILNSNVACAATAGNGSPGSFRLIRTSRDLHVAFEQPTSWRMSLHSLDGKEMIGAAGDSRSAALPIGRIAKGTYIARIRTASGIVSERIAIVAGK